MSSKYSSKQEDPDSAVCAWINKFISGAMPDDIPENRNIQKLVKDLETHMHSDYCRKLGGVCRSSFPKHHHAHLYVGHQKMTSTKMTFSQSLMKYGRRFIMLWLKLATG